MWYSNRLTSCACWSLVVVHWPLTIKNFCFIKRRVGSLFTLAWMSGGVSNVRRFVTKVCYATPEVVVKFQTCQGNETAGFFSTRSIISTIKITPAYLSPRCLSTGAHSPLERSPATDHSYLGPETRQWKSKPHFFCALCFSGHPKSCAQSFQSSIHHTMS